MLQSVLLAARQPSMSKNEGRLEKNRLHKHTKAIKSIQKLSQDITGFPPHPTATIRNLRLLMSVVWPTLTNQNHPPSWCTGKIHIYQNHSRPDTSWIILIYHDISCFKTLRLGLFRWLRGSGWLGRKPSWQRHAKTRPRMKMIENAWNAWIL